MNPALEEELTSINAIFDPNTLELITTQSSLQDTTLLLKRIPISCALRLPSRATISLRLTFPASYPEERPCVSGILTAGDERTSKGEGAKLQELVKFVLDKIWMQGEPCIYALIEECEANLIADESQSNHGNAAYSNTDQQTRDQDDDTISPQDKPPSQLNIEDVSPQWTLSDALTVKDSTFLGRAAAVSSPTEARAYIAHLVATDKRVARATHNITAWRIRLQPATEAEARTEIIYQDSDDDGESAAGGRVLKLMQMLDVWNMVVVVSRWFGGTLLGPERFRCIGVVARDALVKTGYGEKEQDGREQGKGKAHDKTRRQNKK